MELNEKYLQKAFKLFISQKFEQIGRLGKGKALESLFKTGHWRLFHFVDLDDDLHLKLCIVWNKMLSDKFQFLTTFQNNSVTIY